MAFPDTDLAYQWPDVSPAYELVNPVAMRQRVDDNLNLLAQRQRANRAGAWGMPLIGGGVVPPPAGSIQQLYVGYYGVTTNASGVITVNLAGPLPNGVSTWFAVPTLPTNALFMRPVGTTPNTSVSFSVRDYSNAAIANTSITFFLYATGFVTS